MLSEILATFLHVSVDRILGDVYHDIKSVSLDIFARFLEHHKKHGFLIVTWLHNLVTDYWVIGVLQMHNSWSYSLSELESKRLLHAIVAYLVKYMLNNILWIEFAKCRYQIG